MHVYVGKVSFPDSKTFSIKTVSYKKKVENTACILVWGNRSYGTADSTLFTWSSRSNHESSKKRK